MKQTTTIILSTLVLLFVCACGATTYQLMGKKYPAVVIDDPGELYSTYEFTKADRKELIEQGFKDETIRNIEKMAVETNWPIGIKELDGRSALREKMKQYKAFKIGKISGGEKAIIAIPASSNKKMPKDMRPAQDIFFVIGTGGLK